MIIGEFCQISSRETPFKGDKRAFFSMIRQAKGLIHKAVGRSENNIAEAHPFRPKFSPYRL